MENKTTSLSCGALMLTSYLPRELREDLPPPLWFQCWLPQPAVVTTVHLRRASGLSPPKQPGEG